ncbi:unnamed protein product [Chrysoparadoxa australica]
MGKKRPLKVVEDEDEMAEIEDAEMELAAAKAMMEEQHQQRVAQRQDKQLAAAVIFNKEGLLQKVQECKNSSLGWGETLATCEFPLDLEKADAHDDLKREVAFYKCALLAVKRSKQLLAEEAIPYKRPDDFLAEMIKSDEHMAKIKDKLIFEQKKMEAFDQRKQSHEQRKFAKELKQRKAKEKATKKAEALGAVEQWKRESKKRGGAGAPLPDNDGLDEVLSGRKKARLGDRSTNIDTRKNRERKNAKFGFGGPARLKKQASTKSLNDMGGETCVLCVFCLEPL